MRGKGLALLHVAGGQRITPAYAGKSAVVHVVGRVSEDHPRVCGEKLTVQIRVFQNLGSPPRMRGKDSDPVLERCVEGITPAYAGKSRTKTNANGHG